MYPRNAASPEPIAIGPVVQISDGAVQSSGVTVRVKPIGVTEADGGGTTAYSTDGVVLYTPTQAETNYTSFVLIAKKTACIPASVTVVTSARSVSGEVQVGGYASGQVPLQPTTAGRTLDVTATGAAGIDLANVENQGSTLNLTGTTISTSQEVASVTGAVGSVTSPVTVGTNNDKTNYGLSSTALSDVANAVWTAATRTLTSFGSLVTDVTNAVWSAGTRTLTAFGFGVTVTTNNDKTGYSLAVTPPTAGAIADAVWDEPYNQHTTAGTFGKLMDVLRKANTLIEGTVTSAVTPTAGSFSTDVNYTTGAFNHSIMLFTTGALAEQNSPILTYVNTNGVITVEQAFTAAPQVGDAFVIVPTSHVHSLAAIAAEVATITPIADLATMITNDGTANARYTVSALQNGPSGEGGSTINVYPVSASTPERVAGTTLTFYKNENRAVSVVTDFTLTSLTLQFVVEDAEGNDILTIADGSISRSSQTFTVTIGTTVTGTITNYKWSLRDITSGNSVLARGVLSVQDAAAADA